MTPAEQKGTVERLAALARINIPADRREALETEFKDILAYIGQLDELTLTKTSTPALPPLHNVFRADEKPYETRSWTDRIVRLFPAKNGNALSVKKILSVD